ncbi:hypothetical protein ACFPT7_18275 [Acidicapsa dinghuensis]|uniref:Uncharacterized protein n=1 Tax=Acidicapsa dinghuensis TaxID=2218256 RepID=A0ABW1EJG8_9BACT|nr:hypothetical protein [Acidicapsa dinghuensis]
MRKNIPQGLKPIDLSGFNGTAEAVPFQNKRSHGFSAAFEDG